MALVQHTGGAGSDLPSEVSGATLRVGIINIMPRAETYEANLLDPLGQASSLVEPVWIRPATHAYGSSSAEHITRHYRTFEQAVSDGPLDGLILTGAPVEGITFEEVHYWAELVEILGHAHRSIPSTLGLCWGGLALAKLLDIEKVRFAKKLFGAFRSRVVAPRHPLLADSGGEFWCAHSRHSGISDQALEAAAGDGRVTLLAHAPEVGYSVFESTDHRYVMHLGHPEYDAARLAFEWNRDLALGRPDVEAPRNFDVAAPRSTWRSHCTSLFSRWLDSLAYESAKLKKGEPRWRKGY